MKHHNRRRPGVTLRGITHRAIALFRERHPEPQPGACLVADIKAHRLLVIELANGGRLLEARRWHVRVTPPAGDPDVSEWIALTDGRLLRAGRYSSPQEPRRSGTSIWRRITAAVEELQRKPDRGDRVH